MTPRPNLSFFFSCTLQIKCIHKGEYLETESRAVRAEAAAEAGRAPLRNDLMAILTFM